MDIWHKGDQHVQLRQWIALVFLCLSTHSYGELPLVTEEADQPAPAVEPEKLDLPKRLYVADTLKMALRSGPSNKHRIIAFIESGSSMVYMDDQVDGQWIKVEFEGKEGWVARQDIQVTPNAQSLVSRLNQKTDQLNQKASNASKDLKALKQQNNEQSKALELAKKELAQLETKHQKLISISKDAINSHEQNQEFQAEISQLTQENQSLKTSHEILKSDRYNQGLLHGIFAVIAGVLLTLIIPQLIPKKKQSGWD